MGTETTEIFPSPSGPPIPGRVKDEVEAEADAEAEARHQLALAIDLSSIQQGDGAAHNNHLAISVPPPRTVAPPPKVKPPFWLAPEPPPEPQDNYDDFSPVTSEVDRPGDKEALESVVYRSKLKEFLAVERGMRRNLQSLPVTIALWLSFIVLVFFHGQARTQYEAAQFVEKAVQAVTVPAYIDSRGKSVPELRLGTLSDVDHILQWIEGGLVKMLGVDETSVEGVAIGSTTAQSHGQLQEGAQVLIGFVRMIQTRGANTTDCAGVSDDLRQFYGNDCHPPGVASEYVSPNVTSFDDAFRPNAQDQYVAWVEMGRPASTIKNRFDVLRDGGWIDLSTQDVEVDALMLAPLANVYSHITITFKMHREGWLQQSCEVKPLRGEVYSHWTHTFIDIVWIGCLLALFATIAMQAVSAVSVGGLWMKLHFMDRNTWLDVLCLVGGLSLGIFFWVLMHELGQLMDKVVDVGSSLPEFAVSDAPQSKMVEMVTANRQYQDNMAQLLDHFKFLVTQTTWHRLCAFWYAIALAARFYRGLGGQPRIAVILMTVSFAVDYFLHFMLAAVIVLVSFALSGFVLFGEQLQNWSTLGGSIDSLFLVLFGRFEYDDLHNVAPYTALCWYWGVYVFIVLLMANILLAAVLHRYIDVKQRLGETGMTIREQFKEWMKDLRFRQSYEGAQKSIPYDKLLGVLVEEDAHESDLKQLQKLSRMKVDRRLRTRQDLTKEEKDPQIDEDYLVARGCDVSMAEHLIDRCSDWCNRISMTAAPEHRLVVKVAKHMHSSAVESEGLRERIRSRVNFAASAVDRIDLKHAKCVAVARRVKRAQELPPGWSEHYDADGRRILRHDETGLTSWTLPRNMVI